MAATNVTIDDASSLISYEPAGAWTHSSGSDAQEYVNSTYSSTTLEGATASFTFNGTGFWLYGARKPDYGVYVVMVDDEVLTYSNDSASQDEYAQLLGGQNGLQDGQHTVLLMSGGLMDLDSVMLETTAQESEEEFQNINTVVALAASPTSTSDAAASTGRLSTTPNAGGPDFPPNGNGRNPFQPNGQQNGGASSATTVSSSSISSSFTSVSTSSTSADAVATSQGSSNQSVSTSSARKLSKGFIIATVIGSAIGLIFLVCLILFLVRCRRRARARARYAAALPSPALPLQDPDPERASSFFAGRASQGSSYFFSGFGSRRASAATTNLGSGQGQNTSPGQTMREKYLARGPSNASSVSAERDSVFARQMRPPSMARNLSGLPEEDEFERGFAEKFDASGGGGGLSAGTQMRFVDVPLAPPAAAVTPSRRESAHSMTASYHESTEASSLVSGRSSPASSASSGSSVGYAYGGSEPSVAGGYGKADSADSVVYVGSNAASSVLGASSESMYSRSSYTVSSERTVAPTRPARPPDLRLSR